MAQGADCHGQQHAQVDVKDLKERLQASGIHLKHGTERGLAEEAPEAYKVVDDVVDATERAELRGA